LTSVAHSLYTDQDRTLAKPNYSYEKRQKELAKERKKQEKLQRKANKPEGGAADAQTLEDAPAEPSAGEAENSPPPEGT
jgi:septal ring factor EnvC (AmiA/AmiB activator)